VSAFLCVLAGVGALTLAWALFWVIVGIVTVIRWK
jgi:hypothetical protein